MGRKKKWTYEHLVEVANKYDNYTVFCQKEKVAYSTARNLKVLEEITSHMLRKRDNPKWNPETIAAEAKKYKTRKDFTKNSPSASARAYNLGIMNDVCSHMENIQRVRHKWTDAALREEAQKYTLLKDFRKNSHSAFVTAHRMGILAEVTQHMKSLRPPRMDKSDVLRIAKEYQHKVDFRNGNPHAYNSAIGHGIMADACSHMTRKKVGPSKWTLDKVYAEAKKYETRSAFQRGCVSAYAVAYRKGILDDVCSHMKNMRKEPRKWTKEAIMDAAKSVETHKEFVEKYSGAYVAASRMKILDEVMGHFPKAKRNWTLDAIEAEAKKYHKRSDFAKNASGAYNCARRNGLLDKICNHMQTQNA